MGLVYVLIGALVFLMKPRATQSWLFFVMSCFTGMRVSFAAPADLIHPTWFYDLRFLNEALLPASLIHLATRFPQTRAFIHRRRALALAPYVPSILLFVALSVTATAYWNIPRLCSFSPRSTRSGNRALSRFDGLELPQGRVPDRPHPISSDLRRHPAGVSHSNDRSDHALPLARPSLPTQRSASWPF